MVNDKNDDFEENRWVVSDFGLSSFINEVDIDKGRTSYGAPEYIAPEQKVDLSLSTIQSDIFSLGKLISFIMTKKPNNNNHLFMDISLKATQYNPKNRYHDVQLLIQAIVDIIRAKGLLQGIDINTIIYGKRYSN